ncbi:MAG: glycosyltransferase family 4 protein [Muribaculaceae bacterium]|nr:glycosyltransferase family 4 protein [Muribaculaceae bacterium]
MTKRKVINVLYVTHYNELYGANLSLLQMILELREKGVQPTVLLPLGTKTKNNSIKSELKNHEIPYIESEIRIDKHQAWHKVLANYFLALLCRKKAFRIVSHFDFDLIHSNTSTTSIGSYIARKLKKPHVWHLREYGYLDYGVRTPFGKWFQKYLYGGDNTFIAISNCIKQHYKEFLGNQDIYLIYNGIKATPQRKKTLNEQIEFCSIGLLQEGKGQLELLVGVNELVNCRNIRNFHVTIVGGGDNDYLHRLEKYIDDHTLSDYVTLAGRRNDVPEFLTHMDIGVVTSSCEAFGRVTVEYMMAGVAVIASDTGANTEIVEDGISGLIYKKGNIKSLADRMEIFIKNAGLRQKLADTGQRVAGSNFTSEANSNAVYNLYKKILNH